MKDDDRDGFPTPPGFEEERQPRSFRQIRGRFTIVSIILLFGAALGWVVQNKERFLAALAPLQRGNGIERLANRLKRNFDRGNLDQALRDADSLVRVLPREKWPRNMRGLIYGQMKRYQESVAEFTRILEIDPRDATALNNRAYNRALWRQEIEEAKRDIDLAIEIGGEVATFVDTRAYISYLNGDYESALKDLDRVLGELNGLERELNEAGIGEIYFHRGLVHEILGNAKKADLDFTAARKLGFKDTGKPKPLKENGPKSKVVGKRAPKHQSA